MNFRLLEQLHSLARERPEAVAAEQFDADGRRTCLTWSAWCAASIRLAKRISADTAPGSAVLVALGNGLHFPVALMAALMADRRAFPMSPVATDGELRKVMRIAKVDAAIAEPELLMRGCFSSVVRFPVEGLLDDLSATDPNPRPSIGDHASLLLLSSAATNGPRIARRSLASLDAVASQCVEATKLTAADRVLLPVPLNHSYGLEHGLLAPLEAGCTVELHPTFDASRLVERLKDPAVTVFVGVPSVFEAIASMSGRSTDVTTPGPVRLAYSAGSPLPDEVAQECRKSLGIRIGQVFGSTEVGSVTFNDPNDAGFADGSVGKPMRDVMIRVAASDARPDELLPVGQVGHVVVRSRSMFDGYIDDLPDQTHDGFHPTGDLGRIDEHGRLHLAGRSRLLFDIDGRKVNPLEIEAVLESHPDVRHAHVETMPITATVSRLRAVIETFPGSSLDDRELRRYTRHRLSAHKVPRVFEFRVAAEASPTFASQKLSA